MAIVASDSFESSDVKLGSRETRAWLRPFETSLGVTPPEPEDEILLVHRIWFENGVSVTVHAKRIEDGVPIVNLIRAAIERDVAG